MSEPLNNPLSGSRGFKAIELEAGLVLSDIYRLEKLLGQGGMGQVWLATHLLLGEQRAIKFMLEDALQERFVLGEAKNALRLVHPNIVRVHDLSQYQAVPFIVMEYVAGDDLKEVLKAEGKLSITETAHLLEQLAAALAYAHKLGLIHRDIKPANVLLGNYKQPKTEFIAKLSDFGIAKDLADASDLSGNSYGLGTPHYMSPEQTRGEADHRTDQYALGVMLYEVLTGRLPFIGTHDAVVVQHATVIPAPPHELDPLIPKAISSVILKALAKKPEERFANMLELAEAYKQALERSQSNFEAATIAIPATTPSRSPLKAPAPPSNLPLMLEDLLGREKEVAEIGAWLQQEQIRLVSLTGVGGTGKTRLSLAVAQRIVSGQWSVVREQNVKGESRQWAEPYPTRDAALSFPDGVYFVPVENVTERDSLIASLTQTLGIKEAPGQELLERLKTYLAEREMLLVLDNFEQLVAKGATLLAELLKVAPKLKLLVTSRELLRLSLEKEYKVEPLALPISGDIETTPASLVEYAAIALFVKRAQMVKTDFSLTEENALSIAEICRKLDGLPLAIELAAGRVKLLSPAKILERLSLKLLTGGARDLPSRQQTLRGAIEWSYELLDQSEKAWFERLAIFADGCTLDAAEAVCNAEADLELEVMDSLEALMNKSLIKQQENSSGEVRFFMLQTIREFALEKLVESGAVSKIEQNYTTYFVNYLAQVEPKLTGVGQLGALKALNSEYNNLRTVLYNAIKGRNSAVALEMGGNLGRFWGVQGYFSEGRTYLEQILTLPVQADKALHAKVLYRLGSIARRQGEHEVSRRYLEESLTIARQSDNQIIMAGTLIMLGGVVSNQGEYELARQQLEEGVALAQVLGDDGAISDGFNNFGILWAKQGDEKAARAYFEDGLAYARKTGDQFRVSSFLTNLGVITTNQRDFEVARAYFEDGLKLSRQLGDEGGASYTLNGLGYAADNQGDYEAARRYYEESLALQKKLGNKFGVANSLDGLGRVAMSLGDYAAAHHYFDESLALAHETGDKVTVASCLTSLAYIADKQAQYEVARRYLEEGLAVCRELGDRGRVIAGCLSSLGKVNIKQGEHKIAYTYLMECLGLRKELGDKKGMVENLASFCGFFCAIWLSLDAVTAATKLVYLTYAARLGGTIAAWLPTANPKLVESELEFYDEAVETARKGLGEEAFGTAFTAGQALSIEEAVQFVVDIKLD